MNKQELIEWLENADKEYKNLEQMLLESGYTQLADVCRDKASAYGIAASMAKGLDDCEARPQITKGADKSVEFEVKRERPYAWIQWKGTEVCCDIHCACGAHHHFDGDFMYYVKCPDCGQVYEMDGHIQMHPLAFEPEGTIDLGETEMWTR